MSSSANAAPRHNDSEIPQAQNDGGSVAEQYERPLETDEDFVAWAAANGVPEDIFWKPIEIALGAHSKATTWETMSEAFAIFYCLWFSKHEVGKKDGLSITQGSLKSERCERTMENAVKNYLVMVDFDSGQTLDEIEAEVAKRGLFCIIYTTHSHMKAVSEIKQKALSEFLSKSEQSLANDDTNELIEQTRAYLSQVKKYHARVLETVTVSKRSIEGADCTYCISHSPMARARAVFVLDEPFDFTSRNATVEESHREWSERYEGWCSEALGLSWDPKCADPTHLMYLPRHADGAAHETRVISGRALRIDEMPRVQTKKPNLPTHKPKRNSSKVKPRSTSERPSGVTANLMRFIGCHGDDFEISEFMTDCGYEDRGPATDGGRSFECPNEHNHTNPAEGRTRFFVRDASENNGHGFHIYCAGTTCSGKFAREDDPRKQDRAKWLDYICQEQDITDAMALSRYCPNADVAGEEWLPDGYELRDGKILKGNLEVCDTFEIVGIARDENSSSWSKVIRFANGDGIPKELLIENAELYGEPSELLKKFAREGLRIGVRPQEKSAFIELLSRIDSETKIRRVSKTGFQSNGVFVPPVGSAIVPPDTDNAETYVWANRPSNLTATPSGTFEDWQRAARLALTSSSPQIGLGLLLGTCGPMTHCLDIEPHGVFWIGPTSLGKSTAMIAQVGVWSDPRTAKGLRLAARSTANGLEAFFELFSGTTGGVDDLQNGGEALAQDAVYMASNSRGRQRLNKDATGKPVKTWSGFSYAMNAELSPTQLLNGKKTEVAGAYARCPVLDLAGAPLMERATYDAMLSLFENNFAHAGPRLVAEFQKRSWHRDPSELRARFDTALNSLTTGLTSAQRRAGVVFAMMSVMGTFMRETGIIDDTCDVEGCVDWGWTRVLGSDEFKKLAVEQNASENLLEWAVMSGDVYEVGAEIPAGRTPLAFRDGINGTLYLPVKNLALISGLGSTPKAAIEALRNAGRLEKCSDRWVWNQIPGGPKIKHYRVTAVFEPKNQFEEAIRRAREIYGRDRARDCGSAPAAR